MSRHRYEVRLRHMRDHAREEDILKAEEKKTEDGRTEENE